MPNASVEFIFTAGGLSGSAMCAAAAQPLCTKQLWSTGTSNGNFSDTGSANPRAFVVNSASGNALSVFGPSPYNSNVELTGLTHIVVTFTHVTNTAVFYVNGVYAFARTVPTIDGASGYLNWNGVIGSVYGDVASSTIYYVRVWNKTLSQADSRRRRRCVR